MSGSPMPVPTPVLPLPGPVDIDPLDMAALLCSKVCHDLVSPVGAIVNGLEVLEDDNDDQTKAFALDLIKKSARKASARLQFCRLAFGAAGSAGATVDLGDAEGVARGFLEDDKMRVSWNVPRSLMAKNRVKLLLNLLILAAQTIPRGGTLAVDQLGEGEAPGFRITANGLNARVPQAMPNLVAGTVTPGTVDAHGIQPYFTGLLARSCALSVSVALEGDQVLVCAG